MSGALSVAERKKLFEKSSPQNGSSSTTTSPTNGQATGSKFAELRARLDKHSPSNNASTAANPSAFKAAVPRSGSTSKLDISTDSVKSVPSTDPAVGRSNGATKIQAPKAPAPADEAPKIEPKAAPKPVLIKASSTSKIIPPPASEAATETEVKNSDTYDGSKRPTIARSSSTGSLSLGTSQTSETAPKIKTTTPSLKIELSSSSLPEAPSFLNMKSPSSRFHIDVRIPPTVEQQDFYVLWALSFIVPFFLLRFVFELIRRIVLTPARMAVRHAPGGNKFLSFLYVKLGPIVVRSARSIKGRLPPMDAVNAKAKAGLEKFLATLQTAAGAAYPHLLHLAESIKTMRFRQAASETLAVLKAWAPMLLLLIPFTKHAVIAARQAWLVFWKISKEAFYLPFGGLLKRAVQQFGKSLAENPEVFAERVAGLLGPIVGFVFSLLVLIRVGIALGLVDYDTLASFYIAWFFELLGMVSEPSVLDKLNKNEEPVVAAAASAAVSVADSIAASAAAAAAGSIDTEVPANRDAGFSW